MSESKDTAPPLYARMIMLFGVIWAIIGLAFLPLVLGIAYGQGWGHWLKVMWLLLPMVALLTSLKYWYTDRQTDAVADAIVAAGVSFVWLLVIVITIEGREMDWGSLPYLAVLAFLAFTILSFWAFVHSFAHAPALAQAARLGLIYWSLFYRHVGHSCGHMRPGVLLSDTRSVTEGQIHVVRGWS